MTVLPNITSKSTDTIIIGRIMNEDESSYREEINNLRGWSTENNLQLNVSKTKELIVGFRKAKKGGKDTASPDISGAVNSFRFLGINITENFWVKSPRNDCVTSRVTLHIRLTALSVLSASCSLLAAQIASSSVICTLYLTCHFWEGMAGLLKNKTYPTVVRVPLWWFSTGRVKAQSTCRKVTYTVHGVK